jgi:hypothetical protein
MIDMRLTFTLFILLTIVSFSAKAQCVVDTTHFSGTKYSFPDTLPCAVKGTVYDTTVQVKLPRNVYADEFSSSYPHIQVRVDSVKIDSITNLPDSISWNMTPASKKIYAPGYGCFGVYGKTVGDTGTYNIGVWGTIWFNVIGKDTFQKGDFSAVFPVKIRVIEPGTPCYGKVSSIADEAIQNVSIYPIPFSKFINIEADGNVIQNVELLDATGRVIESRDKLNQKKYTLTTERQLGSGFYTLKVTTKKGTIRKQIVSYE